jgi:hypothetical protein
VAYLAQEQTSFTIQSTVNVSLVMTLAPFAAEEALMTVWAAQQESIST